MRTAWLALALGLASLRFLPVLPPYWLLLAGWLVGAGLLWRRHFAWGALLLGVGWACLRAQAALDDRLPVALDGQTRWLEGVVVGLPERSDTTVRFELREATSRREALPDRLRLSWREGPQLKAGERWRLAVTLRRPRGLVNPGGFDHEAWLLSRQVGATGSVKQGERLAAARPDARESLRTRLAEVDAQGRNGPLAALVLGDKSGLSPRDWQTLQATGTVHLLVISGQHIGLLAGLLYGLVAGLARLGLWPPNWPWLPWACGLAFGGALAYGALAGFEVPVRRACLMLGLVLWWRLRYRQLSLGWPLLVAFVVVLLVNPLAGLQSGFWLSFLAVAVLLLAFAGRLGGWRWWQAWTRAQCMIAVGLLPALLALALPVSLTAPLANLLAVPWVSLAVLPMALLGTVLLVVPGLGEALLWLAGGLLNILFEALQALARQVPAWQSGHLPVWALSLVALGALLLLLPAGMPLRPLGLPLLALAIWPGSDGVNEGEVQVWQLDVGQGLAIILRTREHTLLYDAGPRSGDSDAGERVVLPALRHLGVNRIDLMVISHAHADHAGGAASVRQALPVQRVIAGEPQAMPGAEACESGAGWQWNGVRFSLWRWQGAADSNSRSCVLLVEASGERLLLSGDIEAAAERALVQSGQPLAAHWLQAPHHGSRTSSTQLFLRAVQPAGALISRGHGNGFGHPHGQVLQRYAALGITPYDTALHGAIRLQLGRFEAPHLQRSQRRFWRDQPVPVLPPASRSSTRHTPMIE